MARLRGGHTAPTLSHDDGGKTRTIADFGGQIADNRGLPKEAAVFGTSPVATNPRMIGTIHSQLKEPE